MAFPRLMGLLLIVPLLGGCAANDLLVKRQTELESRVEHLHQVTGGLESQLSELAGRVASLQEQDVRLAQQLKELGSGVRELKEVSRELQTRLQQGPTAAPVPKVELVNPEQGGKTREAGPPPAYVKAFGLYSSNSFKAAVEAFSQFLKQEPASEYVPNAHYWIGECYYSSSELPQALSAFQKVVEGWPRHPKAADALLKIGYSYAALKQYDKAKQAYEQLVRNYPGSPAALKGRERLNNWPLSGAETR